MASDAMLHGEVLSGRAGLSLDGDGAAQAEFLQSLLTNDVMKAAPDRLVYAALLTPQGKFLADFLVRRDTDGNFHLDTAEATVEDTLRRLTMYRLRAPIEIARADMRVTALWGGDMPADALDDPRDPALGARLYGDAEVSFAPDSYEAHRLSRGVPEAPLDLVPNETFILEAGFEALSGVDFRKGCYVGQEVVARMKHKAVLRKGYRSVRVSGEAMPGETLRNADGKDAGTLHSVREGVGIAHLRLDRAEGVLTSAGGATLEIDTPETT